MTVGAGSRVASPPNMLWPACTEPAAGAAGAEAASPPAPRLARYSANDSALWIACCLPLGSLGSYSVGSGSRVASPPPKPLPPLIHTLEVDIFDAGSTPMYADASASAAANESRRRAIV